LKKAYALDRKKFDKTLEAMGHVKQSLDRLPEVTPQPASQRQQQRRQQPQQSPQADNPEEASILLPEDQEDGGMEIDEEQEALQTYLSLCRSAEDLDQDF
jgi:hypothetical protein